MKKLLLFMAIICIPFLSGNTGCTQMSKTNYVIVSQMPSKPEMPPLPWKQMGYEFDTFVMDSANQAMKTRADGNVFFPSDLQGSSDELTTFGVVMIGKILRQTDISQLLPSFRAYFNEKAGLFTNTPKGMNIENWYLLNIDALAAAIIRTTLNTPEYMQMQRSCADALIVMANNIDYDYNHQGYNFDSNKPWTNQDIYRQPDVIGGYAYLMLISYEMIGDQKYLDEAKKAIIKYQLFAKNPWYEIPSGAMACAAAARLATKYGMSEVDYGKILAFALDTNDGALQCGKWGDMEVNGLMRGWGNGDHYEAYSMESLVAPMYILPSLRYNTDYAAEIGKYFLNLSSNMRCFYSPFLPPTSQSRADLPNVMPYERLAREDKGCTPYAGGDYGSQRSIYGGAYAMWMGAIVEPTEDQYIQRVDISKTDFLTTNSYPTYLYYNPYSEKRQISLNLPCGTYDLYETIGHKMISQNVSSSVKIEIPGKDAVIVVLIPSEAKSQTNGSVLSFDGIEVDYNKI